MCTVFPIMILAGVWQIKGFAGFSLSAAKGLEESGHLAVEALTGIRTVAAFGLQERVLQTYAASLTGPRRAGINWGFVGGAWPGFSQAMTFWAYAVR